MADTFIKYNGFASILIATILTVKPALIYDSLVVRTFHQLSGLHMSSATTAPGFNQSFACMVAAVGVGHIVAARQKSPAARSVVFAMNITWAILGAITCASPREWDLGSATLLMSTFNHTFICLMLYLLDPGVVGGEKAKKS